MCGFSGEISFTKEVNRKSLELSSEVIRHRGPDGNGNWVSENNRIGFAHRRLAIIDLSLAAHQPMLDQANNLVIVFNGEIYNYKALRSKLISKGYQFETSSDTEVVLKSYQEWGHQCLSHLEGMFSFVLLDQKESTAFIARDRAGEKPFYFYHNKDTFIFSSELNGVLAFDQVSRVIDSTSFTYLLKNGFTPADKSLVKGVSKLPPAHAAKLNIISGELSTWRYWNLPQLQSVVPKNEQELQLELKNLMQQAVSKQMIADVPIGILLSGGLDSSLVTAFAARDVSSVKTFTVTFPSHTGYDESKEASLIAQYFGTQHNELEADQLKFQDVLSIAQQLDEPIFDSSIIPTYLVSSLVAKYCKVALGGDGGDELFGGYGSYLDILRAKNRAKSIPSFLLRNIGNLAANSLPLGKPGRNFLQHLYPESWIGEHAVPRFFDTKAIGQLLSENAFLQTDQQPINSANPDDIDWIQLATRNDFNNYLPADILTKVDRASMLHSLEIRAPFLDPALIEFAFTNLSAANKVSLNDKKIFLKKVAASILPRTFNFNRKQGFSIPLASWMNEASWVTGFSEVLLNSGQTIMNHDYLKKLIANQQKGYSNSERLFGLFLFEVWRTEHNIQYA
jgi:asparagine synthase (glutamine-hydrolysing)